jgi:hypothetical protein
MSDLLNRAFAAHGGLDHFDQFQQVCADVSIGADLLSQKGRPQQDNICMTVDLHQERPVI